MHGQGLGLCRLPHMAGHLVFQHVAHEAVGVASALDGQQAGPVELLGRGLALQAQQTVAGAVDLLGVAPLAEELLYQLIEGFRPGPCLLQVILRATFQVLLVVRAQVLLAGRVAPG